MKTTICSRCGHRLDNATDVEKPSAPLAEGDISVCFYCGKVDVFNADGSLKGRNEDEIMAGLNPRERYHVERVLFEIRRKGFEA